MEKEKWSDRAGDALANIILDNIYYLNIYIRVEFLILLIDDLITSSVIGQLSFLLSIMLIRRLSEPVIYHNRMGLSLMEDLCATLFEQYNIENDF